MTSPAGFLPVPLSDAGGFPQSVPLAAGPGGGEPLRLSVVASVSDLAVLLTVDGAALVRDALAATIPAPRAGLPRDRWQAADAVARAAIAAPGAATLSGAEVSVALVVSSGGRVVTVWPPLPLRRLPVHDAGGLRGELWVDELAITAGSLVAPGASGARIAIAWRPRGVAASTIPQPEGDAYAALV